MVATQERNVDIGVSTRFMTQEEIECPTARDAPGTLEVRIKDTARAIAAFIAGS